MLKCTSHYLLGLRSTFSVRGLPTPFSIPHLSSLVLHLGGAAILVEEVGSCFHILDFLPRHCYDSFLVLVSLFYVCNRMHFYFSVPKVIISKSYKHQTRGSTLLQWASIKNFFEENT